MLYPFPVLSRAVPPHLLTALSRQNDIQFLSIQCSVESVPLPRRSPHLFANLLRGQPDWTAFSLSPFCALPLFPLMELLLLAQLLSKVLHRVHVYIVLLTRPLTQGGPLTL